MVLGSSAKTTSPAVYSLTREHTAGFFVSNTRAAHSCRAFHSVFEVDEHSPVILAVLFDPVVAGFDIFALEKA